MTMPSIADNLKGQHLIAGAWVASEETFTTHPSAAAPWQVCNATVQNVEQACQAAEAAFISYGSSSVETRASFLEKIAEEIDARGDRITHVGTCETALPEARLIGERGRTTGQLRMFAAYIRANRHLDLQKDEALPERTPLPRPELILQQRPLGPVAVFGASNFPLAFSTAGGDTAAALAAGCPVIVKGHPAHPGLGEIVAEAIAAASKALDIDPGVFSLLQTDSNTVAQHLVRDSRIQAVGFTGSLRAGRALFDICAGRDEPIPFFGELGSVNPMFVLPHTLAQNADTLGAGWAGSLTMGAGQFCTNPGIAVVLDGQGLDAFIKAAKEALAATAEQQMLTSGIADAYQTGATAMESTSGVTTLLAGGSTGQKAVPGLYQTTADVFLDNPELAEEIFGPSGLLVVASSVEQIKQIASSFKGQLTCTLHMIADDTKTAQQLMPILERKAGRILANGFPTGVEVCDAMVHGGPYPASTNFGATSVGTMAIRRFLRPVCYQNIPEDLLPST